MLPEIILFFVVQKKIYFCEIVNIPKGLIYLLFFSLTHSKLPGC